ncbi:replication initiation protein [Marinobacterium sp. BA1]|uniref:replication initiation protein n=1 Tax=Marinobacterium sp. BA1 TaxID=3138931 RepID=UPI0032E7073F
MDTTTPIPDKEQFFTPEQMDLLVLEDSSAPSEPLVYKRNELVHGHYDLSAMAHKVLDAILTLIDPFADEVHPVNLSQAEMARLLGISRQTLNECMDSIVSELMGIDLKVPYIQEDWEAAVRAEQIQAAREGRAPRKIKKPVEGSSWTYIKLFDRAPNNHESRILTFVFHQRIHAYIAKLRGNYTYYQLQRVRDMGGKYSIRLYSIFRSALSLNDVKKGVKKAIKDIDYIELRKMLGIKDSSYRHFNKFCAGVLDKARNELMESDLAFTYTTPDRKGPKSPVKTIRFYLLAHAPAELLGEVSQDLIEYDWETLFVKTFPKKAQEELRDQFSTARLIRNVHYYQEKLRDGTQIDRGRPWLRKAILEDYAGVAALTDGRFPAPNHKAFIKDQLTMIWSTLDDLTRDEFLEIGFESEVIDGLFKAYMRARERAQKVEAEKRMSKAEQRRIITEAILSGDEDWA